MEDVISLEHVSKSFGDNNVLVDINLKVPRGVIYGLLGHNGSGKTTTFRLIQGLYTVDNGNITIFGTNPLKMNKKNSYEIGILGEDVGLYEGLSIRENISFFAQLYKIDKNELEIRLQYYSKLFEIEDKLDEMVSKLSRGTKKKVAIVRSFIHHPKLLILDEPLNGLDPVISEKFCNLLKKFRDEKNMTILINSHHLDEVDKMVDDYSIIKKGKNTEVIAESPHHFLKYVIEISLSCLNKLVFEKQEFLARFSGVIEGNKIQIEVQDIEELNEAITCLIHKGILLEKVDQVKITLKERYLEYEN